jgi:hypothetical protein
MICWEKLADCSMILGTPGGSQENSDEASSDPVRRDRQSTIQPPGLLSSIRNLYVPPGEVPVDPYSAMRIQNEENRRRYLAMEAQGAVKRPRAPSPEAQQRRKRQREESLAPSGPNKTSKTRTGSKETMRAIDTLEDWDVSAEESVLMRFGSVIG